MRAAFCSFAMSVCLATSAIAQAQSASPRCLRGVHEGIAQEDADIVVQIVCAEVLRQAPQSRETYVVEVSYTGDQGILSISQVGANASRQQVTIPNIQATRTAAPGLVASLVRPKTEETSGSHWYGWQILLTDTAGVALIYQGLTADSHSFGANVSLPMGVGIFGLDGPIIHLAHGNPGRAALSLGMRGLPILAGYSAADSNDWGGALGMAALSLMTGIAAIVVDSAALAYESAPEKPAPQAASVRWSVAPSLGRTGGGLSLGGVF